MKSSEALPDVVYRKRTCSSKKSDVKFVELCRNLLSHQPDQRMSLKEIIQLPVLREARIFIDGQLKKNKPNEALRLKGDLCKDDKEEVKRIFKKPMLYFKLDKDYEFHVKYPSTTIQVDKE